MELKKFTKLLNEYVRGLKEIAEGLEISERILKGENIELSQPFSDKHSKILYLEKIDKYFNLSEEERAQFPDSKQNEFANNRNWYLWNKGIQSTRMIFCKK